MTSIGNLLNLLIIFITYLLIAFVGDPAWLTEFVLDMNMMSGAHLQITGNQVFILFGIALLYIEIFNSTCGSRASVFEHMFSLLLFMLWLIECLMVEVTSNSRFICIDDVS